MHFSVGSAVLYPQRSYKYYYQKVKELRIFNSEKRRPTLSLPLRLSLHSYLYLSSFPVVE